MKDCDPLVWWYTNRNNFPRVWKLAEEYLAIPATSAPSERAFSSAGNMLTLKRARLGSELVDDGVLLKANKDLIEKLLEKMYGKFLMRN